MTSAPMTPEIKSADLGVFATLRRGVQVSPQIVRGLWLTLTLAVIAAAGRIVIPLTVQRTIDYGILAPGGIDTAVVLRLVLLAGAVTLAAGVCSSLVNLRLVSRTEAGLKELRVRAFRHVHDLAALTQNTERRGSLVSRVTGDVDTISMFVQWGGIMLIVATLQLLVATVLMLTFSWQLTLIVWGCFVPLAVLMRYAQRWVGARFNALRDRVGALLAVVSEAVVGAETVRAYGITKRTSNRINAAIENTRRTHGKAWMLVSSTFSLGTLLANGALAVVVVAGAYLGVGGQLTAGQVIAFLFMVQLFTGPVQMATEILNELQSAVAGWRRVLGVLETPVEVSEAPDALTSPRGPAQVTLRSVRFAYPGGPEVLHGIDLELPTRAKVAVVGQTGSGKTTIAKLVTRLMDPTSGEVLLDGVDLRSLTLSSLRERVVLVPQEGFLFDGTVLDNVAYGLRDEQPNCHPARSEAESQDLRRQVLAAFTALGLTDWLADLPNGVDTAVGQRGEALSAGERQLVAIARAYVASPDLLVLDEATAAVDPATEVRIARALDSLTAGRSTITIAHRLSTAEAADLVVVVDHGNLAEVGTHAELLAADEVYARMYQAWITQTR